MSIDAIAAVGSQLSATASALAPATQTQTLQSQATLPLADVNLPNASAGDGLFDKLVSSLGEIDAGAERSGRAATELALGQTDNLHQVLIGGEQTRLQFELAMSMRNRVLEAYQEIMRMQV
jgi:flagellar hook-basal body complex protein FliE